MAHRNKSGGAGGRRAPRAAVDVGGTFTDMVLLSGERLTVLKVPSTPEAPERGVIDALEAAGARDARLVHGSTVATNTVLERKGARTAFVATEGFSDTIETGRQNRSALYDLEASRPAPLVPASLRFEAAERVLPRGRVEKKLTREGARKTAREVAESGAASAAVCLLFSFENPSHERMLGGELARLGIPVSLSSDILPEYREYERASTTVMNAYITPVMRGYLERLTAYTAGQAGERMRLMHSAGGTVSAATASERPVDLVLSGPAGGVVAAGWLARTLGIERVISFDMGGTSTDVSLIDGDYTVTRDTAISGLPVSLPMIDIHTIGAGGGSIASVDAGGALLVGPESAGADPGPACYGRGELATVTDANLVLGRLEPSWFLGGGLELDPARSARALSALAPGAGGGALKAARATVEVALSHMERALKTVSLERGHDPRRFALVAFGGAGPMHACELAGRLGISRVVVPPHPGLFSSFGMLLAEPGRDYSRTVMIPLDDGAPGKTRDAFERMEAAARDDMRSEGFALSGLRFTRRLAMRYRGQSHEVTVRAPALRAAAVRAAFEERYAVAYGRSRPGEEVEVVHLHLACRARPEQPPPTAPQVGARSAAGARIGTGDLHFGPRAPGALYARERLAAGETLRGPALVLQYDTTTVVPPGWHASVDGAGNLDLESVK